MIKRILPHRTLLAASGVASIVTWACSSTVVTQDTSLSAATAGTGGTGPGGATSTGGSGGVHVPKLKTIAIAPASPAVTEGATIQLSATGVFDDGGQKDITTFVNWSSSAQKAAVVSNMPTQKGLVDGLIVGTSTILAVDADSGLSGSEALKILPDVVKTGAGSDYTCAQSKSNRLLCWGTNAEGELGLGPGADNALPRVVLSDIKDFATGGTHSSALKGDGTVLCWGYNKTGAVGDGTLVNRYTPTLVPGLSNVVEIAAGYVHTCARQMDGWNG